MSDTEDRLRHLLEAVEEVAEQVAKGREAYDGDKLIRVFVRHQLQIIGEACSGLPDDILEAHPEVPWRQIVGMRHFLAHGYDRVDPSIVWNVAVADLAALEVQIRSMIDRD